jgi:pyruvate-formate lyase
MAGSQADPELLLRLGIGGMIRRMEEKQHDNPALFSALSAALKDFSEICLRYAEQLRQMAEAASGDRAARLQKMSENLQWISERPPRTMWQAMQLSYLYYVLAGSFNYGRPDETLGGYLEADLASGELTEDKAYALVKNLWELVIERGPAWDGRIALGGRGRKNERAADRFAIWGSRVPRTQGHPAAAHVPVLRGDGPAPV